MNSIGRFFLVLMLVSNATVSSAETGGISDEALIAALRAGGYNIYFRHAQTDWSQTDRVDERGAWLDCDSTRMRQLSEQGRKTAAEVGQAMRSLNIPVHSVVASPYCRTVETARLLGLGAVEVSTDIINLRVASYFGGDEAIIRTSRALLARNPPAGANVVLIAHGNVARRATQVYPGEAEAIVFGPSDGGFEFFARISPQRWHRMMQISP